MKGCDCQGVGHVPWCRASKADATIARSDAEIAADVAERIAAWLDEKAKGYAERCRKATRGGEADTADEFGWAASYADGFAEEIRRGEYKHAAKAKS